MIISTHFIVQQLLMLFLALLIIIQRISSTFQALTTFFLCFHIMQKSYTMKTRTNLTSSKRSRSSEIMHSKIMEVEQFPHKFTLIGDDDRKMIEEERRNISDLVDCELAEIMNQCVKQSGEHKVIIFLEPNVPLLLQRCNVIKQHTKLKVEECSLNKDVSTWDSEAWNRAVNKNEVLVMTPETFLDALMNVFLVMDSVCLILLDECHHATGNHPCMKILKEFYRNCQKLKFQAIRKGKFYTKEICKFYNPAATSNTQVQAELESLRSKYDTVFFQLRASFSDSESGGKYDSMQKRLSSDIEKIMRCLDDFGMICAYEAVKTFLENSVEIKEEYGAYDETSLHKLFLLEVLASTEKRLQEDTEELLNDGFGSLKDLASGDISPKILELFKIFKLLWRNKKVSCLVLVEESVTAKVIVRVMKNDKYLSRLTVASTETSLSDDTLPLEVRKEFKDDFLSGKINVLITTYMAKGIDVPDKSLVIRFDQPKTINGNFQSDELLDGKDILCITMLERGNIQQRECFRNLIKREYTIKETATQNAPTTSFTAACTTEETSACNKVYHKDALSLVSPSSQRCPDDNAQISCEGFTSGAGTTKLKELHGTTRVRALTDKWGDDQDGITFHAYRIHFSCNIAEERYSNFVLLLNSKLDDDVGNIEVGLNLISKFVTASVSAHGLLHLNMKKINEVKCLHTFLFNGIFGKLIVRSPDKRHFELQTEESLWGKSDTMYLLLPLNEIGDNIDGSLSIDWVGINSCVFALDFLKENAWLKSDADRIKGNLVNALSPGVSSDVIHLSNKSVSRNDIKEMVVVSIHTGRVYSIVDAVDWSAESIFDVHSVGNLSTNTTFVEYFREQYGITLQWPDQPLLLLKQSHNSHNLLTDFKNRCKFPGNTSGNDNEVKPLAYIHMPPELVVGLDVKLEVVKSFYLIPSVIHRLESLMLASQLRKDILCDGIHLPIPSSLILEALTTQRCNESFSMERLELLGDSVLKYTTSCYLYLNYPRNHEGQLSDSRMMAVSNSNLHRLGINQNLQVYIRDSPFDPRRWKAPGQLCTRPIPCKHGVDSWEVPLESRFSTENTKVKIGEWCDKGHRWMVSKTISDCVEALVGACYIGGGLDAALKFMKWLGLNVEIDEYLIEELIKSASLHTHTPKAADIGVLELKLGYKFSVKGLLVEALTHGTEHESDVSYQRLEYLGDAVLDLLITIYLYLNHKDLDPGRLTDLRSACVSNANFGHASLRHNLYRHLQHSSGSLHCQISEFVKLVSESSSTMKPLQDMRVPKVLGDMMESIAGAILVDSKFDRDEVWNIFKPILSPIVTPDKLELPPYRELIEICSSLGVIVKETFVRKEDKVNAELKVQLEDVLLVGEGHGQSKKVAKGTAALSLLRHMEMRGISLAKVKNQEIGRVNTASLDNGTSEVLDANNPKKEFHATQSHPSDDFPPYPNISDKIDIAVIGPIDSRKGGARQALNDLCKRQQWLLPTFQTTEYKSRSPIEIFYGNEMKTGFSTFESQITLKVPDYGVMKATGETRLDKKSSFDTAAMAVLKDLEEHGKVIIVTE